MAGQETVLDSVPDAGNTESNRMWALPENLMAESASTQLLQWGRGEWWDMHEMGTQRTICLCV